MMTAKKISKLYIITKDENGHLHHFVSAKAMMHLDIVLEYDIDLDRHTILEKGFIHQDHRYTANFDVRGDVARRTREARRNRKTGNDEAASKKD